MNSDDVLKEIKKDMKALGKKNRKKDLFIALMIILGIFVVAVPVAWYLLKVKPSCCRKDD
ncbi:MAG: hypothetical protein FWE70_03610 [Oscillospiraceae bacterium]|nr:hypothetical protein [Oscillospiraceae bacterium]